MSLIAPAKPAIPNSSYTHPLPTPYIPPQPNPTPHPPMTPQDLNHLESTAAEILGTLKSLFTQFESHLTETTTLHRTATTQATQDLHTLRTTAQTLLSEQRALITRLEKDWHLRIDQTAHRAGEAQAQAFGEKITQGLQAKVDDLSNRLESTTRNLTWKNNFRWAAGIAVAIPLTIGICVTALVPPRDDLAQHPPIAIGLTPAQAQEAVTKLSYCQVPRSTDGWHVCIEVENPPRIGYGEDDQPRMVVRGM
jgi:hypothetical protein